MNISKAFAQFPSEGTLVGQILAGYTSLELDLMNCVKSAREDFDTVFKAIYRARGETQRINIADAFGRQAYRAANLGTQFEMAIGAVRYCLRIRNLYAHSIWWNDNTGQLAFANLEDIAKQNDAVQDLRAADVRHVSVQHLQSQLEYFEYASDLLIWVLQEENKKAGRPAFPNLIKPKARAQPPIQLP